jgi:F-type H+-transporting ATPase subunit alpha
MKRVAAKLRLDLASYNELLNFARLGTELDASAQAQLDRGARMVELLKQPQFTPMTVGEQVITIFAGSTGLLDDIPVNKVNEFGVPLIKWIAQEYPAYITEINTTGKLSDELAANITAAINKFKEMQK